MSRRNAAPEVFREAAQYYMDRQELTEALSALRRGIEKTGDEGLVRFYEDSRYAFAFSREFYEEAGPIYRGTVQVARDGLWGIAAGDGYPVIPCRYDQISTYDSGRAFARKDGVISAIDQNENRLALLHLEAEDFGNWGENRIPLKTVEGWVISGKSFKTGTTVFQGLGMYSEGYAAAQLDGKWGLVDTNGSEWLIEPAYDGIVQDELGRSYARGAVFVRRDGGVYLWADGQEISGPPPHRTPVPGESETLF